ncbi:hypothetical protein [Ralstonia chuxiongensis]|uniref:Uncharacterized protein n=1 Tax=Ralstonia chuxiongensis TaxID=2957504 RepID=A0AA41WWY1_9RALS|nr:hypothetical protein [Ralstonia chuxiongensis]MCP1174369.1 hypothetical protein [Ralstonia chuxiongensis]
MRRSALHRLASGYFSHHPAFGLAVVLFAFGLAGAIAPEAAMVLGG